MHNFTPSEQYPEQYPNHHYEDPARLAAYTQAYGLVPAWVACRLSPLALWVYVHLTLTVGHEEAPRDIAERLGLVPNDFAAVVGELQRTQAVRPHDGFRWFLPVDRPR